MAWLTGWSYRKKFTIPAAQVTGTHSNFIAYLNLGADSDLRSNVSFLDGRDIRITSDNETTVLDYELVPDGQYATYNGVWTWFNGPEAIKYGGKIYSSWVSSAAGHLMVCEYNISTEAYNTCRLTTSAFQKDDHNNPAIAICSDGKLLVLASKHNVDSNIYQWKSTNVEDATAWESMSTLTIAGGGTMSYANLERLSSEGTGVGRIYCFFRRNSGQLAYIYTEDDGANWTNLSPQDFWDGNLGHNYFSFYGNGTDRIDCLLTEGHPNQGNKKVYHIYYTSGTWYNSNGTAVTENNDGSTSPTLPLDSGDLNNSSTIFSDATDTAWVWDIYNDGNNVHALWTRYPSDSTSDHDYYYSKLSSGSWTSVKLCDAGDGLYSGEPYYSGGMCFAPGDGTTIYLSKQEGAPNIYEIQRWVTSDNGTTWAKDTDGDITTGSTYDNFRPVAVRGASTADKMQIMWCGSQSYTTYTDYNTGIRIYPGIRTRWEHAWVKVPDTIGSTDVDIYVYYGNSSASDGQDPTSLWAGYGLVCHGHRSLNNLLTLPDTSGNGNDGTFYPGTAAADHEWVFYSTDIITPVFSVGEPDVISSNEYISFGTAINLASLQRFTAETFFWWDPAKTDENCLLNSWANSTNANFLWRLEPSGNVVEAFVAREANTSEGGNLTGLTASQDAWHYGLFSFNYDAASNADIICRVDQAEATYTCTSSAAMDATATSELRWGLGTYGSDGLRGFGSEIRVALSVLLSKDYTDTQYDNLTDYSNFLTIGAEVQVGAITITTSLDGKVIICTTTSALLDCMASIKNNASNILDGAAVVSTTKSDAIDGKAILKNIAASVFDSKASVLSVASLLLDCKAIVSDTGAALFDGKGTVKDSAYDLVDGKSIIKSTNAAILDGKSIFLSTGTPVIDGKIIVNAEGFSSVLLDGKTSIKSVATNYLDGLIYIGNAADKNIDGKAIIKSDVCLTIDGKTTIQDVASNLLDGSASILTSIANIVDGKIIISDAAIGLLDGNATILDDSSIVLDGKVFISSGAEINIFDGKITLSVPIVGKVAVTFSMRSPAATFSIN